ncbi:MAG: hypothetical protein ACTS3F_01285 [Phycisphaerales bacterium]
MLAIGFDDSLACGGGSGAGRDAWLGPLTDLRSAALVRTGALTTLERWAAALEVTAGAYIGALLVPEHLDALTREQTEVPVHAAGADTGWLDALLAEDEQVEGGGAPGGADGILLVSMRCVHPPAGLGALPVGSAIVEVGSGAIIAARVMPDGVRAFAGALGGAGGGLGAQALGLRIEHEADRCVLHRAWDVIRFRDAALDLDLALLGEAIERGDDAGTMLSASSGVTVIGDPERITIAEGAIVMPSAVLDASAGPIVIDHHAVVRPMSIVQGPAYIGERSTVLERCHVKAHTAIGPVCKVNGEIGGTIFQGYANKAHEGHLGDSYIGQWVNLGAGTTNSNLLNTYSPIKTRATGEHRYEDTGLVFLGAIIGDHTKTAIGTLLTTGAVIGTGCMLASSNTVPQSVRAFTWLTNEREQAFRFSKFVEVATAAMARRQTELTPAERSRLEALNTAAAKALRG